jgi:hypothetical protein
MKKAFALLLVAALMPLTAVAQQPPEYGRVTTLDGSAVNIARPNAAPLDLKFKDPVFLGNRIETKAESLVKMLLSGKALVTVREQSSLTITETENKTTINLANGKVAIFTKKLPPGDSIEVRTPNAIASVRGSLGIVEALPNISHVDNGDGTVLGAPSGGTLLLIPRLQGLTIMGNAVGPLRPIRPDVTRGLISKGKPGPGQKHKPSQGDLASDLAALGGGGGAEMPGTGGARVLPGNPKSGIYVP